MPVIGNQGGGGGLIYDSAVNTTATENIIYTVPANKVFRGMLLNDSQATVTVRLALTFQSRSDFNLLRGDPNVQQFANIELGAGIPISTSSVSVPVRIVGALYINA